MPSQVNTSLVQELELALADDEPPAYRTYRTARDAWLERQRSSVKDHVAALSRDRENTKFKWNCAKSLQASSPFERLNVLIRFSIRTITPATKLACLVVIYSNIAFASEQFVPDKKGFAASVQPFFRKHCVECHGPDVQEGEFVFCRPMASGA